MRRMYLLTFTALLIVLTSWLDEGMTAEGLTVASILWHMLMMTEGVVLYKLVFESLWR